jgi:hypothetical protein
MLSNPLIRVLLLFTADLTRCKIWEIFLAHPMKTMFIPRHTLFITRITSGTIFFTRKLLTYEGCGLGRRPAALVISLTFCSHSMAMR